MIWYVESIPLPFSKWRLKCRLKSLTPRCAWLGFRRYQTHRARLEAHDFRADLERLVADGDLDAETAAQVGDLLHGMSIIRCQLDIDYKDVL